MNNSQTATQKAIWYYTVDGERRGPLTTAALVELYKKGIVTKSTLIWRQGLSDWKPLAQFVKGGSSSAASSMNGPILAIIIAIVVIIGGTFGYFQFFATTPLEGGWQAKNFLGVTNGIMLLDRETCWLYDSDNKPYSVHYQAVKDGENSYKLTLSKDASSGTMILLISFVDNDTINVATPGSTDVYKMTRINTTMAKSMMGIS